MSTAKPMPGDVRAQNYMRANGQSRRLTPAQLRRVRRKFGRNMIARAFTRAT